MNILLYQKDVTNTELKGSSYRRNKSGTGKHREHLDNKEGTIEFLTGENNGQLEICVQSYMATSERPSMISLNINMSTTIDKETKSSFQRILPNEETVVLSHSGAISGDLTRLEEKVKQILSLADYSKEYDTVFHNKSVNLNKAVRYWPILRAVILLIGGYLQMSHVVKYMRRKHIM